MIPAIAVAYLILAALLLWLITGNRGRWQLKLAAIAAVLTYGLLLWNALDSYTGWPTKARPPADATFIAGVVQEPEPGHPGAIYLWLTEPDTGRNPFRHRSDGPRAHRLPYTRQGHQAVAQAQAAAARGEPTAVSFTGAHGQPLPAGAFRAYRLPPPQPPVKVAG